jgi:uncharacterized protein with HEPN domain
MRNPIVSDNLKIIVESIDLIEDRFSKINLADDFVTSPEGVLLLDAISMRLQVIGETVKKIDKIEPSLFEMYRDVEWRKIMRLRDIISHHYEMVDHEITFDICETHLPRLKSAIQNIIRKENQSNSGNSA